MRPTTLSYQHHQMQCLVRVRTLPSTRRIGPGPRHLHTSSPYLHLMVAGAELMSPSMSEGRHRMHGRRDSPSSVLPGVHQKQDSLLSFLRLANPNHAARRPQTNKSCILEVENV